MLGPELDHRLGTPGDSTLLEQKGIRHLTEGLSDIVRRGTLTGYKFFGQLNLSWLTSVLVHPHVPRKGFVANAHSPLTARTHVCEVGENNFCQLHTSWLTSLGLPAVVRGLDVTGRRVHLNRTLRKMISPIACFMANSGMDLRFTLNFRGISESWIMKFGPVATPLRFASNFLPISHFMAYSLDRFAPDLFRRFDNLVVLP